MGSRQRRRIAKLEQMTRHLLAERDGLLLALGTLRHRVTDMHASMNATAQENVDLKHRVRVLQERGEQAVAWVAVKPREFGQGNARLLKAEFVIDEDQVMRHGSPEERLAIAGRIGESVVAQLGRRFEETRQAGLNQRFFQRYPLQNRGVSAL